MVILLRIDTSVKCAIMNTKQNIMKTARKQKQHYVDNQEFLAEIIKYRESVQLAKAKGLDKPRVNNYIGGCFLKIATHLIIQTKFHQLHV